MSATTTSGRQGRLLTLWTPEDKNFWEREGEAVAKLNLWISVPALFLAFAIWQVWSVVAVSLPGLGFKYSTNQLFWLAAAPALSGATLGVRRRLDIFGVLVLSFIAATAGGITRDLLIGATPPAALSDWRYPMTSLAAGIVRRIGQRPAAFAGIVVESLALLALGRAVLTVTIDVESAVVGHDTDLARAATELHVMAAQSVAAECGGRIELRLSARFTGKGLDHAAR